MAKSALKRLQDGEITQAQYQAEIAKSQAQATLKQSATGTLGDFGGKILEPSQIGSGNYVKDQVVPDVFKASDIGITPKTNLEKAVEQAEEKAKTITEADGSVYRLDEATGRYKRDEAMTQAQSERSDLIRQYEQQNSIQSQIASAGQMMSDAQQQAEAARINREKRANDIRTKEGEAGRNLERGFSAFKSAGAQSVEGVQSSARPQIMSVAKDATGKAIDRAIGSDAEMNRLNQIESGSIDRINKLQEAVRGLKVGEAYKIEDFQQQLAEELENMKTGMEKQDTDKLYSALNADTLSAIAQNPDSINMLLSAYPNAKVSSAQILGMAQLQSIVNEYQSKKVLTPEEQLKFDQAKANLDKTRQEIAQAGQTEADKLIQGYSTLSNALSNGTISQEAFDSLSIGMGFAQKPESATDVAYRNAEINYKNAQTETERAKALKELETLGGAKATGFNVLDKLAGVQEGRVGLTGTSRGQCGEFVNDVLGEKIFGDSLTSKKAKINSQIPTAGSVFISGLDSGGGYGHVGFVEQVLDDGRLVVVDSNRYGNEKVNRRTVDPTSEKILGYYNAIDEMKSGGATKENQVVSFMGGMSKVSEGERELIKETIKEHPTASAKNIADIIKGYDIKKEADFDFADNLRKYALGIEGAEKNLSSIAESINRGDKLNAINIIESEALKGTDKNYKNEQAVKFIIDEANRANELLKTVNPDLLGAWDGATFPIEKKFFRFESDADIKKAQQLQSVLTGLVSKLRNELSGTAVTDSEAKFLEPLITGLTDEPDIIATKLQELKNTTLARYNASRTSVGARLPAVTENQIINPESKVQLYMPPDIDGYLNGVETNVNSKDDDYLNSLPQ